MLGVLKVAQGTSQVPLMGNLSKECQPNRQALDYICHVAEILGAWRYFVIEMLRYATQLPGRRRRTTKGRD